MDNTIKCKVCRGKILNHTELKNVLICNDCGRLFKLAYYIRK